MKARINGTEMYFDVEGPGLAADGAEMVDRPVVFALHGGPGGDHVSLRDALSPLSDTAQIVYIDHRGSGRSAPADPATYTLDQNIDDVDALRDYLGLDRISVLGVSYGGMVGKERGRSSLLPGRDDAGQQVWHAGDQVLVVTSHRCGFGVPISNVRPVGPVGL